MRLRSGETMVATVVMPAPLVVSAGKLQPRTRPASAHQACTGQLHPPLPRPSKQAPTSVKELSGKVVSALAAATFSGLVATWGGPAGAVECLSSDPVCDTAKVLPALERESLSSVLRTFEGEHGWKIRVLTKFAGDKYPTGDDIRKTWSYNGKTVVVLVDPSSPNILNFTAGEQVRELLKRPFFTELQSRFGNQFFVRDNGPEESVLESVDALKTCLREGGCVVVPGLDASHYYFTLIMTVAGGLVLGFSTRLDPRGFAQRRWVPPMLLSPLWGSLFISYGLGPVVTRTTDVAPVAANCTAFLLVAAAVYLLPRLGSQGSVAEALLEPSECGTTSTDDDDASA